MMTIMVCPRSHRSRLNIVSAQSAFTLKSKYDVVSDKRAQSVSCNGYKRRLQNVSFPVQSSSTQVGTAPNMMGLVHHTDEYQCSKYAVWNTALDFFFLLLKKLLKCCVWGTWRVHVHVSRTLNTYWCSGLLQGLVSEAGYVVDDGREVGGTVELNLRQTHPVRFHHTFDSCAHIDSNAFTSPSDNLSIFTEGATVFWTNLRKMD